MIRYILLSLVFLVGCGSPTEPTTTLGGTYTGLWPSADAPDPELVTITVYPDSEDFGVYEVGGDDVIVRRFFRLHYGDAVTLEFMATYCPDLPTFRGRLVRDGVVFTGTEVLHGGECAVSDQFPVELHLSRAP